jgi:hypothetical protein
VPSSSFSLGFWRAFPPPWPYFKVCVSVAVFLLTETSLKPARDKRQRDTTLKGSRTSYALPTALSPL